MSAVTFEEMNQARDNYNKAWSEYKLKSFQFLSTVLIEAGVFHKLVKLKGQNLVGQFQVAEDPYTPRPWTIKFFPMKKTCEEISTRAKILANFFPWQESNLVQQLKEICEVVGDLP